MLGVGVCVAVGVGAGVAAPPSSSTTMEDNKTAPFLIALDVALPSEVNAATRVAGTKELILIRNGGRRECDSCIAVPVYIISSLQCEDKEMLVLVQ